MKKLSNQPAPEVQLTPPTVIESESKPRLQGFWDDGFYFKTADDQFTLRVRGLVNADYRNYQFDNDSTNIDQFNARRARIGLEANLRKNYEFRLLVDFGNAQPRLLNGFLNIHYWDEFQVQAGRFKEPFSYEQLLVVRFMPFMERSLIDQVVPARDVGVMMHGQKLLGDRLDWAFMVANGERDGNLDTNDGKDVAGRVAVRPFRGFVPFLDSLQLGCAMTAGVEQNATTAFILRTPATIPFFRFLTNTLADGLRWRLSPEVAWFQGPFGIAAQYFHMEQEFRTPGRLRVNVPFEGFYLMSTCFLTGEKRDNYNMPIDPLHPFDPRPGKFGIGAWEAIGRVSRLLVGDNVFFPGRGLLADPTRFSNGATEMTLGFNWYLNRFVRFEFNYEHAWFDRPVQLGNGPNGFKLETNTLQTRLQVIY